MDILKKYERIVCDLAKAHILLIRYVERNTTLRVMTMRDMERVLQGGSLTCTYGKAIANLKQHAYKLVENETLLSLIVDLEKEINENDIRDLRFGIQPHKPFSSIENELDNLLLRRQLYMTNEMMPISVVAEKLGIKDTTIKQAAQQERLLNTQKLGKTWLVHLPECEAYWNKNCHKEGNLYLKYIY